MRAMHKRMHRAYGDSPHNAQTTINAVYQMSYYMPVRTGAVLVRLQGWLSNKAKWRGKEYTSPWVQPDEPLLHMYSPIWNKDYDALRVMREACCQRADCVFLSSQQREVCMYVSNPAHFCH